MGENSNLATVNTIRVQLKSNNSDTAKDTDLECAVEDSGSQQHQPPLICSLSGGK